MIRIQCWSAGASGGEEIGPGELPDALGCSDRMLWLDLGEEPAVVCEPILREVFGFHPLAVEDALAERHIPKIDDWGRYVYLVLHAVGEANAGDDELSTIELDIFVGERFLVSHHSHPLPVLDRVWELATSGTRFSSAGGTRLLHSIAAELTDEFTPAVEWIDEALARVEDEVLRTAQPALLEDIMVVRRSLLHLRRVLAPQRDVLDRLARLEYAAIDPDQRVYFRDIGDHLVRLHDITSNQRELATGALEIYLSVTNNRMTDVMKTLTVITVLLMPITFLTGFFGMNFFRPVADLSAWTDYRAFAAVLLVFILVPTGMVAWMRRRAWM